MTPKDVLDEYNRNKSIRATALNLGISQGVVRKALITYRVIDSPRIQRIAELRAVGLPSKDIAKMLNISPSCVDANTPYVRGTYLNQNKTANAAKLRAWRKKREKSES